MARNQDKTKRLLECEAQVGPDRTLRLPEEVAERLAPGQRVRMILVLDLDLDLDADESADWRRLTAEEFLKGYAEGDSIYDRL